MEIDKNQILKKHSYTELVYDRINKKLGAFYSKEESEILIKNVISKTEISKFQKIGKNFYISSKEYNIKITINSNTFRIITVDKLVK
jgi:hypothetical protein